MTDFGVCVISRQHSPTSFRALFLSIWAYQYGSDSISGFVHDAAGYAVLGLTIVGLLILIPIFTLNPVPEEYRSEGEGGKVSGEK